MNKTAFIFALCLLFSVGMIAQENSTETEKKEVVKIKKKDKPVRSPWNSGVLLGGQTSVIPSKGSLRFGLAHNFGSMDKGTEDLFGIYAPAANVRMGLDYVVYKNIQVGAGITKNKMMTDINAKWTILEQTRKYTIPVSVTVYGNIGIDGRNKEVFGIDYTPTDRLSYFGQVIVGHKINKFFSVQAAGSFTHFNSMSDGKNHDQIAIHFGAKGRVTPTLAIIANSDIPLKINGISEYRDFTIAKPNIQVGVELKTPTHAFNIYVGTANEILMQNVVMDNLNNFNLEGLRIGFILTKL